MLKRAYVACVRTLRPIADRLGLLAFLQRRSSRSRTALWLRSLFAIYDLKDMTGLDLPWWTLSAVKEADAFLKRRGSAKVFEYGSGASTIWLARRAASVVSVEKDLCLHGAVQAMNGPYTNARVGHKEAESVPVHGYISEKEGYEGRSFRYYASAIDEAGLFDLIVIDGRARAACLRHSLKHLAPGGIIIFDNSGRERYRSAIKASGLSARTYRGMTACLPYPDETTILRSDHTDRPDKRRKRA